jgi:multidrug efflux pump subunit AcrA (membrane-fusion protein)
LTTPLHNAQLDLQRYTGLGAFASRQQLAAQQATVSQLEAQTQGDEVAIESARTLLSYTTVVSPMDGVTGIRLVDQGDFPRTPRRQGPREGDPRSLSAAIPPILITRAVALLAGLPLMLGNGTGSEIRQPLGYAIVGGSALSQIFTLYTTPVVYLYLSRFRRRFYRRAVVAEEL